MAELATIEEFSQNTRNETSGSLADHFLTCAKLGRYLTVSSGSRFVITDDLREENVLPEAAAVHASSLDRHGATYTQGVRLRLGERDVRVGGRGRRVGGRGGPRRTPNDP